ncbi:MAG: hypothetical protein ACHQ15_04295 [Candidatus Limnocylindrales bacterium]
MLALIGWGLGHIALSDRRGWLLLLAEVVALALLVGVGLPRLEGDAVDGLFLAVVLFFLAWAAQAVDAYRRAIRSGLAAGGAIWLLALIAVAVVVFGGFWMAGGATATATAALERYVAAWRQDRPEVGDRLLLEPQSAAATAADWAAVGAIIEKRLGELAATLGDDAGLDPRQPFASLEFRLLPGPAAGGSTTAEASIVIVRHVSVRSTFLGLFPTATQETEVLDEVGVIELASVPLHPVGALTDWPASRAWRIVSLVPTP